MTTIGCAPVPPAEPQAPVHGEGHCDAAKVQKLIGRTRTEALGREALRLSGAKRLRWIPEGGVVTMDYSPDRLNLHLDRSNKVARINCG